MILSPSKKSKIGSKEPENRLNLNFAITSIMIITIDGPSGTGKSTIAKRVAALLGFSFFDTGAMYRAVAWAMQSKNISMDDETSLQELLENFHFEIHDFQGQKRYSVNSVDVTEAIRTPEISAKASAVAALPKVREALWKIQRDFAHGANSVFEGRDMGTAVFPSAEIKVYLTAQPEVRARRRYQELLVKQGPSFSSTEQEVYEEMLKRDERDSSRALAPLKKAKDAKEIDTSNLDIEQVVAAVMKYVDEKKKQKTSFLYRLVITLARIGFRVLYRHRVYGVEHIVPGPAIVAANHTSFLDPPFLSASVPEEVFFLARKTLFKGWFGKFIYALNARPVSGDAGDVRVFREIETILKGGGKLILFPEGTRSPTGELGKLKGGISIIVSHSRAAVIPAYLHGIREIWGRGRKFPKLFGKTACVFGSALSWDKYASLEKKAAQQQFAEDLREAILALKKWYEEGAKGTPP